MELALAVAGTTADWDAAAQAAVGAVQSTQ